MNHSVYPSHRAFERATTLIEQSEPKYEGNTLTIQTIGNTTSSIHWIEKHYLLSIQEHANSLVKRSPACETMTEYLQNKVVCCYF